MPKAKEETKEKVEEPEKKTEAQDVKPSEIPSAEGASEKPTSSKKEKTERSAIAHINSSPNNTSVHITDLSGNTISRVSGGMVTKQARLRSNPTNAMFIAKRAGERAKDLGITSLYIRMKGQTGGNGTGPGAHAAVKTLDKEGFNIINVLDVTRVPRGGPKRKGGRRGRRV